MASKRHLRRRSCEGKYKYRTLEEASRDAKALSRQEGEWLISYGCRWCGGFHVGHIRNRTRQSILARRGME